MANWNASNTANDSTSKTCMKKRIQMRSMRKTKSRKVVLDSMKKLVVRRAAGRMGTVKQPTAATSSGRMKKKKRSVRKAKLRKFHIRELEKLVSWCAARTISRMEEPTVSAEEASGRMNCHLSDLGKTFLSEASERTAEGSTARSKEEPTAPAARRCGQVNRRLQGNLVKKFIAKGATLRRKADRMDKMHRNIQSIEF